jgi:hypothetical protein
MTNPLTFESLRIFNLVDTRSGHLTRTPETSEVDELESLYLLAEWLAWAQKNQLVSCARYVELSCYLDTIPTVGTILGFCGKGLKGVAASLSIMESITKKCNKCKKTLCVEVFGDNGRGECFKTCDACREKNRTQKQHKTKMKPPSEEEEEADLMRQLDLIKDDTVCDITNAALFIEKICRYVGDHSF